MKTPQFWIALVTSLLLLTGTDCAWPQCSPSGEGLNDGPIGMTKGGINWKVYYTDDSSTSPDYCTAAIARSITNIVDRVYDRQVTTYGFRSHLVGSGMPNFKLLIYDSRDWGTFNGSCITLDAASVNDGPEVDNRGGVAHEMVHSIQYRYRSDGGNAGGLGDWLSEGVARCMDDRHFADHDDITLPAFLWDEAKGTMRSPETQLTDLSYRACLWWSYLCEQLGSTTTEPGYGVDFLRRLYERLSTDISNGTRDALTTLGREIRSRGRNGVDDLWQDYTICNVAREFDATALPNASRYLYVDEQPGHGGGPKYDNVKREKVYTSLPASETGKNAKPYSARYYEYRFSGDECGGVGFRCTADDDVAVSLLGITPAGRAILLSKSQGRNYGRLFINPPADPITKLIAVVAGLSDEADYDYQFGSGTLKVSIVRPDSSHRAYAGAAGRPETVLARVYVEGIPELTPAGVGRRSVMGLQATNITATIGGLDAPVLTASYVGGEYWLLLDAPDRPNGVYDLAISLCGQAATLSRQSVEYGDRVALHAVVLDNSGSMGYPDNAKMVAAQKAASLYIDSVSTNDWIGAATFTGNGAECDEDAKSILNPTLVAATPGNRQDYKDEIARVRPDSLTSIGDGVYLGYEMIKNTPPPAPTVEKYILLLSDGLQNEDAGWNSSHCVYGGINVRSTIMGSDVVVNTIALGPDSDQALMQQIATETTGDYTYIDVSDAAPAPLAAPGVLASPVPSSVELELAEGYMDQLERARRLQRLVFQRSHTDTATTHRFKLGEIKVTEGLFYVFWEGDARANVVLTDPRGNVVDDGMAVIYKGRNHVTYHFRNLLDAGDYEVALETGDSFGYFFGLAGRPFNEVRLSLHVSQVRQPGRQNEPVPEQFFTQGMPVTLLAVLTDKDGPLSPADVSLRVTLPDGTVACGPKRLYDDGTHGDGEAGDGIYAVLFTQTQQASHMGVDRDFGSPAPPGQRGSYRVHVEVRGESHSSEPFTRQANTSFQVYTEDPSGLDDTDKDGAADGFERYYGLNPLDPADGPLDPDRDGLTSAEEFQIGTHPFDADTDNGGEADGSEVLAGRCPFDPDDDVLPPLTDVELVTRTGCLPPEELLRPLANLIRFPVHKSYQVMRIYRSLAPDPATFALVAEIDLTRRPNNLYYDEGLTDGQTYYYLLQAVGARRAVTPFSRMLMGTAKKDPFPPKGWLVLNHNAQYTDRPEVVAKIDVSADAIDYRLSNLPLEDLGAGTPWSRITDEYVVHTLDVSGGPGLKTVHHQLRDKAGNTTIIHRASIIFDPFGDFDRDGRPNNIDLDDDGDGLPDDDELFILLTNPFDADTDGDGIPDGAEVEKGLDPTDMDSDQDGLTDGEETELGTDPLGADSDRDGIPDGFEQATPRLDPLDPRDARSDEDGDGHDARSEFIAGTDPNNADSVLSMLFTETTPGGGIYRLRWPAAPGRTYHIFATDQFNGPETIWNHVAGPLLGRQDQPEMQWQDPLGLPGHQKFYRVTVDN